MGLSTYIVGCCGDVQEDAGGATIVAEFLVVLLLVFLFGISHGIPLVVR